MAVTNIVGVACMAALLAAGPASAAPMGHGRLGIAAPVESAAMLRKGTAAGNMKQRQRTRTTRCNNVPSRC